MVLPPWLLCMVWQSAHTPVTLAWGVRDMTMITRANMMPKNNLFMILKTPHLQKA
jgi:hypothetical protein